MLCNDKKPASTCRSERRALGVRPEPDRAESPDFHQPGGPRSGGGGAPLGRNTKSVDRKGADEWRKTQRALDFSHQRTAAKLLPKERVKSCRWAVISKQHGVEVALTTYEDGAQRARFSGLQVCGSVWLCPCCGKRISEVRRSELNQLLAWSRSQDLVPVMLTLTARHKRGDKLAEQLKAMKKAKRRLRQRREWRAIKERIVGTVTATEVTVGAAGWHTHFHEIALVSAADEADAIAAFVGMPAAWQASLRGQGLDATRERGFSIQGAAAAGSYVGKWGAAEEVALGGQKQGRGGMTPRQLLAAAHDGDEDAGRLWREFGAAFKGSRQLVWSPGLKALAGIGETDDADAAEGVGEPEQHTVAQIAYEDWRGQNGRVGARERRARILDAAEAEGAAGVARVVADHTSDDAAAVELIDPEYDGTGAVCAQHRPADAGAVGGRGAVPPWPPAGRSMVTLGVRVADGPQSLHMSIETSFSSSM